jgi:hypothetical protein
LHNEVARHTERGTGSLKKYIIRFEKSETFTVKKEHAARDEEFLL